VRDFFFCSFLCYPLGTVSITFMRQAWAGQVEACNVPPSRRPVFYIVRSGLQSGLDGLPRSSPVRPLGRTAEKQSVQSVIFVDWCGLQSTAVDCSPDMHLLALVTEVKTPFGGAETALACSIPVGDSYYSVSAPHYGMFN
jgi:hypothetical protein